jgi:hypothetical protein
MDTDDASCSFVGAAIGSSGAAVAAADAVVTVAIVFARRDVTAGAATLFAKKAVCRVEIDKNVANVDVAPLIAAVVLPPPLPRRGAECAAVRIAAPRAIIGNDNVDVNDNVERDIVLAAARVALCMHWNCNTVAENALRFLKNNDMMPRLIV